MRIFFDVVLYLGLLGLGLGGILWLAPQDDNENVATGHFIALAPLGMGLLLFLIGLIGRLT